MLGETTDTRKFLGAILAYQLLFRLVDTHDVIIVRTYVTECQATVAAKVRLGCCLMMVS